MSDLEKVELIIHPVRLRIMQALAGEKLTTGQIAARLPDIPKSSIYRHVRLLLEGEMIGLAETRLVNGIQEKVYELAQPPHLGAEDLESLTADEHFRTFTTYILTLLHEFAVYLARAQTQGPAGKIDLAADKVGYTEGVFFADEEELDAFQDRLQAALAPLARSPGAGRQRRKIALITHPLPAGDKLVRE